MQEVSGFKNSAKILLNVTAACLCVISGIFIGRNMLPNYFLQTYPTNISDSTEPTVANPVGKININTASAELLLQLPGIGMKTAENIITYREENGTFSTIEDLLNVEGIGYGTLYNIHELITTGG